MNVIEDWSKSQGGGGGGRSTTPPFRTKMTDPLKQGWQLHDPPLALKDALLVSSKSPNKTCSLLYKILNV